MATISFCCRLARFLQHLRVANVDSETNKRTILMVTHDVELVAQCAERVILMGDGEAGAPSDEWIAGVCLADQQAIS